MENSLSNNFIQFLLDSDEYDNDDERALQKDFLDKFVPMIILEKSFSVKLEDLAEILDCLEANLKNVLLREMKEGKDFKIEKGKSKGGRPKDNIWLSSDTETIVYCSKK